MPSQTDDLHIQANLLTEKFEKGMKDGFGVVLILNSIHNRERASSLEIKEDMRKPFDGSMSYNYTSFYRLMNKLRDEYKLIEERHRTKAAGPDRIYYALTDVGELVYENIMTQFIKPLQELS